MPNFYFFKALNVLLKLFFILRFTNTDIFYYFQKLKGRIRSDVEGNIQTQNKSFRNHNTVNLYKFSHLPHRGSGETVLRTMSPGTKRWKADRNSTPEKKLFVQTENFYDVPGTLFLFKAVSRILIRKVLGHPDPLVKRYGSGFPIIKQK